MDPNAMDAGVKNSDPPQATLATRYADAWNAHDLDAIMALHADDTDYQMDGGGTVYRGKDAVRAKFASQLAAVRDLHFTLKSLHFGNDHLVFEARITGETLDGVALSLNGIDLITVRDDQVVSKHSYAVPER